MSVKSKGGLGLAARGRSVGLLSLVVLLGGIWASSPASAQKVTPSHVYQVTEDIVLELNALHVANLSKPTTDPNSPALTPRQPRHVYQIARQVFYKVQQLRFINGLEQKTLPPAPTRDITPGDVIELAAAALMSLKDLRPVFDVHTPPAPAKLVDGKSPTDVFANLQRADQSLDGLGITRTAPNEVMQVALTIVNDLKQVLAARGVTEDIPLATGSNGKKPGDVYHKGTDVLMLIKKLGDEIPELKVKGGVVMPNDRQGMIGPNHVLNRLNDVLAELMSLKVQAGVKEPTIMASPQSGKTPSNVYDAVLTAEMMVSTIK